MRIQKYSKPLIFVKIVNIRWILDQPKAGVALWGARRPEQLKPLEEIDGWSLDEAARQEIDRIIDEYISDPVGPGFMAPPTRKAG